MNSNMQKHVSGDLTTKKSNRKAVVSSAEPNSGDLTARKPSGKAVDSSVEPIVRASFTGVSPVSAVPGDQKSKKLNGKAAVSSADPISGDLTAKKPNGKDVDSSAEPIKRASHTIISPVPVVSGDPKSKQKNGKAVVSSAEAIRRTGNAGGSCADVVSGKLTPKKLKGKAVDSSSVEVLFFKDVKFGPQKGELRFRLIHFWEARNAHTKILIGIEMILIDEQGTVIQGFIPPSRIDTYLPHMIAGSLYRLIKFYGSKSKTVYRVSEQDVTISFSWNYVLSVLENCPLTPKKLKGKAVDSSSVEVLFFKDVKFGPQKGELRFRLIHFWEARNAHTKILIGIEMILIDEQGTVIQGFIPPSRIDTYLPHMIAGSLYRLIKFYGSKSKTVYRVSEQDVTISFSWNYVLSVLENCPVQFLEDRFRFYGYEEF
ncbi:hypothetical protein YC2023_080164 [Brassica napus]